MVWAGECDEGFNLTDDDDNEDFNLDDDNIDEVLVSKKMTSLEVLVSKIMAKIIPGSWLFDLPPSVVWWFAAIGTATPTRQLSMTFR